VRSRINGRERGGKEGKTYETIFGETAATLNTVFFIFAI
jgi:hypothetical protein